MRNEALIIVDMSNDFVADNGALTAGKPAQEIIPYIHEQAQKFLKRGGTVVIAMDAHTENDPEFKLWPPHNIVGTEGQKLYGVLQAWYDENIGYDNLVYLPKTNYNAFFKTDLAHILKTRGIKKVHITGACTDICVYLTASGAYAEGFKTVIHKNGVATFTDQGETFINQARSIFHTEIIE